MLLNPDLNYDHPYTHGLNSLALPLTNVKVLKSYHVLILGNKTFFSMLSSEKNL